MRHTWRHVLLWIDWRCRANMTMHEKGREMHVYKGKRNAASRALFQSDLLPSQQ